MTDDEKRLIRALGRLSRRRLRVRVLRWSGPVLLLASLGLLVLFSSRSLVLHEGGADFLPVGGMTLACLSALALVLALLLLGLVLVLRAPGIPGVARELDRRLDLHDLLAAGLSARRTAGVFAREVVCRSATAATAAEPKRLYPARALFGRTAAFVVLALAALYLLGFPPGRGWIPLVRSASRTVPGDAGPSSRGGSGRGEAAASPDRRPEGERRSGGETPRAGKAPADGIRIKVVPMKDVYGPLDPVTLFVVGEPERGMEREHTGAVTLSVDGRPASTGASITVRPGKGGLLVVRGREVATVAPLLTPGRHVVEAVMREADRNRRSDPVEIRIRGSPPEGGGGAGMPKPKSRPGGGGEPPPALTNPRNRFVVPLFRPGAVRKKEGYALVPDPHAPPGTAPRRLPLDAAAREAGRRPESRFAVEKVAERDRALVRRYFERLREGR